MRSMSEGNVLTTDSNTADSASDNGLISGQKPVSTLRRVGLYTLSRVLTIAITIVVGVFLSIVVIFKDIDVISI